MGICYKLILEDEFNWNYLNTSKDHRLEEFVKAWEGYYIERVASWYGYVVYDIDKNCPYTDIRKKIIREYCDRAYYIDDISSGIKEIELPYNKPSDQAEINRMDSRRTFEEKKASEDIVRKKLERMKI